MIPVVKAQKLTKKFKNLTAVDGIDFEIRQGECFGFLGPNGAGKTTTVRMIYCFTPLTSGTLTVLGLSTVENERTIKSRIGVCPQEANLDPDFSVEKNLQVYARYFGLKSAAVQQRIEELLVFAELTHRRKEKVDYLSGGMKRRLLLARALLNKPQLLILDEPTTGLDPQARHMIWDRIRSLKQEGVTIILTTHYMDEAEYLCDRLLFIDHGKIIETGVPSDLIDHHVGKEVLEIWEMTPAQRVYLEQLTLGFDYHESRALLYSSHVKTVLDQLQRGDVKLSKIVIRPTNLEDVFLRLTGRELRE